MDGEEFEWIETIELEGEGIIAIGTGSGGMGSDEEGIRMLIESRNRRVDGNMC